jgi:hypothetical protein
MFARDVSVPLGDQTRERIMPVGLPNVVETAEPEPDLEAVQLFCLGGLTVTLCLLHLLPVATVNAMMLLACAG